MINKKVILLAPFEYYYQNRLTKYIQLGSTFCAELSYYRPLEKIFNKVIAYDYLKRTTEIGITGINEEVIDLVRKEHPDYIIWTGESYEFQESTFDIIRKEGTKVIGFFYDDEYRFEDYSKWWIPHLDYCVTGAIEAVPKYRKLGARGILARHTTGSMEVARDWTKIKEKYDVSFVGAKNLDRERYINELKKRDMPIHLCGGKRGGGYIPIEEMLDIYWSSKINLNFSKGGYDNKILQMKARIFEVPMAGGFLLTEYVPGLENYFEIDKEIVCFKNAEEMIDKINYYLNHNEERRTIAKAGWEKARANYTPFHILSKLFKEIEKDITTGSKKDEFSSLKFEMPRQMRKNFSNHYFSWGLAFAMTNSEKLWKDALSLSLSYNPLNIRTWYGYLVGFSPSFLKPALFWLYKTAKKFKKTIKILK